MTIVRFSNLPSLFFIAPWMSLILSFSSITSCSQVKKKINFYPSEYRYPDSSLVNGKTFVYKDVDDTSVLWFIDRKIITEGSKHYFITKGYNSTSTIDSAKSTMDGEVVESYIIMGGELLLKGEIVRNEIIDDGSRLGKSISVGKFGTNGIVLTIRQEEYFLKDTAIYWQGRKLDCIKTRLTTWTDLNVQNDPSANENGKKVSEGYFAKGIGLIRYLGLSQNKSATMELIEIREMTQRE